ncbi:hypothetical protein [Nocardia stercoris]|uniref:hypothetical protein n=1 Tax=Nocardia stercoris TaxID=2483361 RepID=UPI001F393690|nr:hypothetical protein [Nocardia stercoris]
MVQFTNADDTPKRWYLKGRAAVFYKESVTGSPIPVAKMSTKVTVPVSMVTMSKGGRSTRA